jgi:release factor glutamine methyltransferase
MATVSQALAFGRASLREDSEYPARDAALLLALALDKPSEYPYLHPEAGVTAAEDGVYRDLVERRRGGEPVAYLRGYREFMGFRFKVDRRVLIPRPETEMLVEAALRALRDEERGERPFIADLCCGSGAVGLSLARVLPEAFVALADVSSEALAVARENAVALGVAGRVVFLAGDLASPLVDAGFAGKIDVLVANPPYIPEEEIDTLPRDVRRFEPRLALDGGPGGLKAIGRIAREAQRLLKPGGSLFMEIGDGQGRSCEALFSGVPGWLDLRVLADYSGRQRVFAARRREGLADQGSQG